MSVEEDRAARRREAEAAQRLAGIAREAMRNEAIAAYFDEIETKAIDAILACEPQDDLKRLRLSVVAGTVRGMRRFLADAVDGGAYAEQLLAQLNKEDKAR